MHCPEFKPQYSKKKKKEKEKRSVVFPGQIDN
jgi:hypothetical protein